MDRQKMINTLKSLQLSVKKSAEDMDSDVVVTTALYTFPVEVLALQGQLQEIIDYIQGDIDDLNSWDYPGM